MSDQTQSQEVQQEQHSPVEGVTSEEALQEALGSEEVKAEEAVEGSEEEAKEEKSEAVAEEKDRFASKFAALSRKEKALRQREQEMQARIKELEEKASKASELETWEKRLQENPLALLEEKGVDFGKLTNLYLDQMDNSPEKKISKLEKEFNDKLEAKIKELEERYNADKTKEQEAAQQKAIENFKSEINQFVESNSDEYELVLANDATDLVFEVIEEHYNETSKEAEDGVGKVLSVKEAADHVERYLFDQAQSLLKLKKLQKQKEETKVSAESPEKSGSEASGSVTLSNDQSTQVPSKVSRKLSAEESLKEAAKLIRWED